MKHPMKRSVLLMVGILWMFSHSTQASLYDQLMELKKICDAQLLTAQECTERRQSLLKANASNQPAWFCNYAGEHQAPQAFSAATGHSFSETASASAIVKDILDEAGLAPNFIVRPANVPNAAASSYDGRRYIEYNPNFVHQLKNNTQTNWTVYSVMAHEIGHHLQGHTIQAGGSRPDIELEADEYSGFILARLGADLPQSLLAMQLIGSDGSSGTHPGIEDRLKAIEAGWLKGQGLSNKQPAQPSQPAAQTASEPATEAEPMEVLVTEFCVLDGLSYMITNTDALLSYGNDYMQIGERQLPLSDQCLFDLLTVDGRYCVVESGEIYFDGAAPVGRCEPCDAELCGDL